MNVQFLPTGSSRLAQKTALPDGSTTPPAGPAANQLWYGSSGGFIDRVRLRGAENVLPSSVLRVAHPSKLFTLRVVMLRIGAACMMRCMVQSVMYMGCTFFQVGIRMHFRNIKRK